MLAKKPPPKIKSLPTQGGKDRYFNITIKILPTREVFTVKKIYNEMKIRELKALAEFATGIPYNMQKLRYLDEGKKITNPLP